LRVVIKKVAGPGPGHNAWQMTSTALVIFMTLPGLALFYGGLVRRKNVLSVLAQCWASPDSSPSSGGPAVTASPSVRATPSSAISNDNALLQGVSPGNVGAGYYWISDSMWAMFQLTFAIITPASSSVRSPSA
jgi:Amt family ammonium transporter